ncbi:unnamed protein product [Musa acuminata subsp. malaccensis]|uniref:(wild Malaysian banana) hypothetical protein n=1 Tax=Musa acuminata subsp. malaccensis TaxID=214687 RepID=A0A804K952_MUSAM|nr:unnamed protein product [Musa acuminata subsp. malaccensis]
MPKCSIVKQGTDDTGQLPAINVLQTDPNISFALLAGVMLHINPVYGGMTSRIIPMDVDKHQVTNQVGPRNDARPTVQMHFKLSADKNLGSDNQGLDKLVSH